MKIQKPAPFCEAWIAHLKQASGGAHIASLPEVLRERASAPPPYEEGKPWETNFGHSPPWDNWWATSTCVFVGNFGTERILLVVHNVEPPNLQQIHSQPREYVDSREDFVHLAHEEWHRLVHETPVSQRFSLVHAMTLCQAGRPQPNLFSASSINQNTLFHALFGEAREIYVEAHRLLGAQYLIGTLRHSDQEKFVPDEYRDLLLDPPIIKLNVNWIMREALPAQGAIGRYIFAENMRAEQLDALGRQVRHRQCELDTEGPHREARFMVVSKNGQVETK